MKERCVFDCQSLSYIPDQIPCAGKITKHHLQYRSEGGSGKPNNLVNMCEGHQNWVHSPIKESEWIRREEDLIFIDRPEKKGKFTL